MLNAIAGLFLTASSVIFAPPVSYDISLAGNFGEPRPNHFHGGIDVKTGGVEGKPIYTIADGYVSRITVGHFGFGNAVYVTHPNGVTSVYCHLRSFSPRIKKLLRRWQYSNESYLADVRLSPLDCPVAQGQLIAVSGNTGASSAPHLHLEIHDTRTWDMLDPLDFLGAYVQDGLPPAAHGIMVYPVKGHGTCNGGSGKQAFGISRHTLSAHLTAWGKVGFGIWADDYAEHSYNRFGVKETILSVDGREVFHSNVTDIPVSSNLMVNSWGDYEHYYHTGIWYMKSFVDPGNTLSILKTDENRGIVDFSEERDYRLMYVLRDFHGNESAYEFVVRGEKTPIPSTSAQKHLSMTTIRWNRANMVSLPGMQLVIPAGMLADNTELRPVVRRKPDSLSPEYSFYHRSFQLFGWGEISIAAPDNVANPEKLYIVSHHGTDRFMGGTYRDGWVTGRIRELGADYELGYDDSPPQITPIAQKTWESGHIVKFGITDDKSGIKAYRGYVDGRFVLFEKVEKTPWVVCRISDTPVRKTGKMHRLKFVAVDNRDNEASFEAEFLY